MPVFNEEVRLPEFFSALEHAEEECSAAGLELLEVVVVDDGSVDATASLLTDRIGGQPAVRRLDNGPNRGKGAVVAAGLRIAAGDLSLITDVDLSTPLSELPKLVAALDAGADVAMGSRTADPALVQRSLYRAVMSRVYNGLARALTGLAHRDTQCGFKLVPTPIGRFLVEGQLVERWAFDVESLMRARSAKLAVAEVPVVWKQDDRSTVTPLRVAARMALDTAYIAWKLRVRGGAAAYPPSRAPATPSAVPRMADTKAR